MDHLELEGSVTAYAVPVDTHRRRGCPQLEISRDQLEYLVSLSFNWTQIAAILGVSRMTVYRRRQEFGMLDEPRTNISDGELLVFVEDVRRSEPESGEVIVMGELLSHGYRVTRHRVRHAIQLTDPLGEYTTTVGSWLSYKASILCPRTQFPVAHWYACLQ